MTMLTSYDPRTGQPFGEPIAETDAAGVDAVVGRAQAAAASLGRLRTRPRADALEAVAAALDDSVDALVEIADRETALGEARLRGEVARTTGQLRMFADLARDGNYTDPIISLAGAGARPSRRAADAGADRAGRGVQREQLPVRVLGGRR